jgi:hypothetical protein
MSKKGQKSKKGKGKKRKEVGPEVAKTAAVFSQFFSKRKKVDNNGADDNDGDDKAGARDEAMRPVDPSPVEGGQRLSPPHTPPPPKAHPPYVHLSLLVPAHVNNEQPPCRCRLDVQYLHKGGGRWQTLGDAVR